MTTLSQVDIWVEKSVAKENLKDYKIKITGSSGKDEGYLGDIIFVTVEGTTEEDEAKTLHFVVKKAKPNEQFRKLAPMKLIFENEIYLYTKVIPAFQKFQREKNVKEIFDCVAKCYFTTSSGNTEGLVLENLKMAGFEQLDRKKPLNLFHCKAILEQYGRLHAVSFAMKDQNRNMFTEMASKLLDVRVKLFEPAEVGCIFEDSRDIVLDMFQKKGDTALYEKLSKLLQKGSHALMMEVLSTEESQSVVTHGDCWCNNFLFKYGEGNKNIPLEVAIIDWQISSLRSPVFDLSCLLYSVCSKKELESFEDLLEFYYNSFSELLIELGSNPEELFTYTDLKSHWRKYSLFQLIHMTFGLRLFLCDKDDAPSFDDLENVDVRTMFKNIKHDEGNLFYDRMRAVASHYFDYLEKDW